VQAAYRGDLMKELQADDLRSGCQSASLFRKLPAVRQMGIKLLNLQKSWRPLWSL
jgi:hypothetical protein